MAPAAAPVYAAPAAGFGTVAGYSGLGSAYTGSPLGFGTVAYQANLPALNQPLAIPQYQSVVAQQSGYTIPSISTQAITAGLQPAQSMVAYPGVSAMQGPFTFTQGATYVSGATAPVAADAAATPAADAKAADTAAAPAEKAAKKKKKKAKKGCC